MSVRLRDLGRERPGPNKGQGDRNLYNRREHLQQYKNRLRSKVGDRQFDGWPLSLLAELSGINGSQAWWYQQGDFITPFGNQSRPGKKRGHVGHLGLLELLAVDEMRQMNLHLEAIAVMLADLRNTYYALANAAESGKLQLLRMQISGGEGGWYYEGEPVPEELQQRPGELLVSSPIGTVYSEILSKIRAIED